jgi:hypothetical protein
LNQIFLVTYYSIFDSVSEEFHSTTTRISTIFQILLGLNSALNPYLYAFISETFRKSFTNVFIPKRFVKKVSSDQSNSDNGRPKRKRKDTYQLKCNRYSVCETPKKKIYKRKNKDRKFGGTQSLLLSGTTDGKDQSFKDNKYKIIFSNNFKESSFI